MYRPNFCAECGARVERARWRLWTSGRFCAGCARRFRKARLLAPAVAGAGLLLSGFVVGRLMSPASPPPIVIHRAESASAPSKLAAQTTVQTPPVNSRGAADNTARYGPDGTTEERPTDPDEVVSTCGARTKKGTPCSRRVRGTGRCWQHKGKPAMLPPEKLVVRG
jgi:hypothetical protein